ncbi:MAG: hypothetical protein FGM39_11610 [Phycisphaerales bacterium]|nr:hypothetical protein [Phycisphaerales bacterium]
MLIAAVIAVSAIAPPVPRWTDDAVRQHVTRARAATLDACRERGISLPPDFVAWVDRDPARRTAVYGWRPDPMPVLLGLRSLEIDLGTDTVRRDYPQLALAFAIHGSYAAPRKDGASPWNDGDAERAAPLPDVSARPKLVLGIPADPRVRVDTKDASRPLDRDDHVINFLEDHAIVGADVIASAALQREFNAYMAAHGHPEVSIDCGDGAVRWNSTEAIADAALRERIKAAHELFHAAYRAKGRMPAERDRAPTHAESMAWFVRNDRAGLTPAQRQSMQWPRFPLNAPWPVLMMLVADDQPLREREAIWTAFRDTGELRTYGEYIDGIAQQFDMQSARRVSPFPFSYGSIQMMWKDGGVCGTMGNIGARTLRIAGVPASTAGQPGHCAIVFMDCDRASGRFACKGGQYASGGDEVTTVHAWWAYDDEAGRRPMVFHQAIAWAVNRDAEGFTKTLAMARMFDALPPQGRAEASADFARAALKENPYALPAVLAAIEASGTPGQLDDISKSLGERLGPVVAADGSTLLAKTLSDRIDERRRKLGASARKP